MTTIDEHKTVLKELLEDINEKIRADLISERQKILGFSTSEASMQLLAILLHKKQLISPGFNVNHRYFASKKRAEEIFNFDFSNKNDILDLLVEQEAYRDKLCYGRQKDKSVAQAAIENLFTLKQKIDGILGEEL